MLKFCEILGGFNNFNFPSWPTILWYFQTLPNFWWVVSLWYFQALRNIGEASISFITSICPWPGCSGVFRRMDLKGPKVLGLRMFEECPSGSPRFPVHGLFLALFRFFIGPF